MYFDPVPVTTFVMTMPGSPRHPTILSDQAYQKGASSTPVLSVNLNRSIDGRCFQYLNMEGVKWRNDLM